MYTSVLALAALSAGAAAQSTVISALMLGEGFRASVIGASQCTTTLAVACVDQDQCPPQLALPTLTFTQGPSNFGFQYGTSVDGAAGSVLESCTADGPASSPTQAVCHVSLSLSGLGVNTALDKTLTIPKPTYASLTVTAGADKLTAAGAACSSGPNAASTTGAQNASTSGTKNAAAPTAIREVYKVIVPVGAAALMALA